MDSAPMLGEYSEGNILRWLDQAKVLLEQTLARISSAGGKLNATERQAVTDNLVLIANVVTHLGRHALRPPVDPAPASTDSDGNALADSPAFLARLTDIHNRMQVVYQRLQGVAGPLN